MDRLSNDEARQQLLTDLTRECADAMTSALAAGLPRTVDLIDEALGEYMQDNQARAKLLRKTAAGENPMQKVVSDLIWHEAEQRAEQDLQREERRRAEEAQYARIEQRVHEKFFAGAI